MRADDVEGLFKPKVRILNVRQASSIGPLHPQGSYTKQEWIRTIMRTNSATTEVEGYEE
jgi:hypothetical protein